MVDETKTHAPEGNPEQNSIELVLAMARQHLFSINGIASPIPYEILECINEEPVFCTEKSIQESVDLAEIKTITLVTNAQQQVALPTNESLLTQSVPVAITEAGLPILAAIRQQVSQHLGLPEDSPRRPTIIALLHQPSLPNLSKAAALIYHMQLDAPPSNYAWQNKEDAPDSLAPYLAALEHLPS